MTLRHIRIFLAVCDHDCNVTRAAQALYMAQPAVSAAIRELEEEYGVEIPSEDLEGLVTVGDVIAYLKDKGVEE